MVSQMFVALAVAAIAVTGTDAKKCRSKTPGSSISVASSTIAITQLTSTATDSPSLSVSPSSSLPATSATVIISSSVSTSVDGTTSVSSAPASQSTALTNITPGSDTSTQASSTSTSPLASETNTSTLSSTDTLLTTSLASTSSSTLPATVSDSSSPDTSKSSTDASTLSTDTSTLSIDTSSVALTASSTTDSPTTLPTITTSESSTTSSLSTTTSSTTTSAAVPTASFVNGDFESGQSPWYFRSGEGSAPISIQDSSNGFPGHNGGDHYAFIHDTLSVATASFSQQLTLQVGHTYKINFWYALGQNQNFGTSGRTYCDITTFADGGLQTTTFRSGPVGVWQPGNELTFVAKHASASASFTVVCYEPWKAPGVDVAFDDCTLTDTGLPPVEVGPDPDPDYDY